MRAALIATLLPVILTAQQPPPIRVIDFYGLHHVPRARVEQALGIREGDPLPESKEAVEARLAKIPGVRAAHVGGTCCYEGGFVLWIGIEENGAPKLTFRDAPKANIHLPDALNKSVDDFYVAMEDAVRAGRDADDASRGYSLMVDPKTRAIQQRFIGYAKDNLPVIRQVLWNAASDRERAHAAQVIAYAPDPRTVVPDLVHAIDDPSDDVRNTAMRALAIMAAYSSQHPDAHIQIPVTPFIKLLNSPVWTDRNKSLGTLRYITANRSAKELSALRREAMPALIEAAHWKLAGYAESALYVLGHIGGMREAAIAKAIEKRDVDAVVRAARHRRV
jgi:hypothetical protein